jgi:hypothetical protein
MTCLQNLIISVIFAIFFLSSSAVYSAEICTVFEVQEKDWNGVHSGDFVEIHLYLWACPQESSKFEEGVAKESVESLSFLVKKVSKNSTLLENNDEMIQITIKNKEGVLGATITSGNDFRECEEQENRLFSCSLPWNEEKNKVVETETEKCVFYQFGEIDLMSKSNSDVTAWEGPCLPPSDTTPYSNGNEKNIFIDDEEFSVRANNDSGISTFFSEEINTEIVIPYDRSETKATIVAEGKEGFCFDREGSVVVCMSHIPKRPQCRFFSLSWDRSKEKDWHVSLPSPTWEGNCFFIYVDEIGGKRIEIPKEKSLIKTVNFNYNLYGDDHSGYSFESDHEDFNVNIIGYTHDNFESISVFDSNFNEIIGECHYVGTQRNTLNCQIKKE